MNAKLNGTPRNFQSPGHIPPVYRDNYSNVIIGGLCDGHRVNTPADQQVVALQPPPKDLDMPSPKTMMKGKTVEREKIVEMPPPDNYRWTTINSVNGKALNPQKILVDLVDRFWFRVQVNLTDADAVKLLVANYSKLETT